MPKQHFCNPKTHLGRSRFKKFLLITEEIEFLPRNGRPRTLRFPIASHHHSPWHGQSHCLAMWHRPSLGSSSLGLSSPFEPSLKSRFLDDLARIDWVLSCKHIWYFSRIASLISWRAPQFLAPQAVWASPFRPRLGIRTPPRLRTFLWPKFRY